jgi:hypothetical protein
MLDLPVLSIANARLSDPLSGVGSLAALEERIGQVPWFSRLGRPSAWDQGAVRLHDWDEWPGPENPGMEAWAFESVAIFDALGAGDPPREGVFRRFSDLVHGLARRRVAFDPSEDSWHGPTLCVWDAAYSAGLVACVLDAAAPVPEDLVERWAWLQAGHWPCGYAADPTEGPQPLLVL